MDTSSKDATPRQTATPGGTHVAGPSPERPTIRAAGIVLGIGFGGFFDGIFLHQILQWHHMLTATGEHPATTVAGLEANTLADGLFHAFALFAALLGLYLLWRTVRAGAAISGAYLAGLMLAGWGIFNLVEGLIDHQILTVHHVNADNVVLWDVLFLALGAVLLIGGLALARYGERSGANEGRDASPARLAGTPR